MAIFKKKNPTKKLNHPVRKKPSKVIGIGYEHFWDAYSKGWFARVREEKFLGDEWKGINAGAAESLDSYKQLIFERFIAPYIAKDDTVIELGIGGGKTTELLLKQGAKITCVDISQQMIERHKKRFPGHKIKYIKTNGSSLKMVKRASAEVFFSYDTFVHLEAADIYNYLSQIPRLLTGKRLVILHVANSLSERGFERFLKEAKQSLNGTRLAGMFSVITDDLFLRMLHQLGYQVVMHDTTSVPRDTVWVLHAPEV